MSFCNKLAFAFMVGFVCAGTAAQESGLAKQESERIREATRKNAESIVANMVMNQGVPQPLKLREKPLLSYREAIGDWTDGSTWVWGTQGRPAAMLSLISHVNRTRTYEFLSFSDHELELREPGGVTWTPKPSWAPKSIPDTTTPVSSRRLRMAQMRGIARRFSANERDFFADRDNGVLHQLRLLPTPTYRYDTESDESLDGGMFAFVRDGDLELMLVIEAEKGKNGEPARWVFNALPVTVHELNLLFDKKPLWSLRNRSFSEAMDPKKAYFIHRRPLSPDERRGA